MSSKIITTIRTSFLWRVFSIFQGFELHVAVSLLLLGAVEGLGLAIPYFVGLVLNGLTSGQDYHALLGLAGGMLVVSLLHAIFIYLKDWYELEHLDFFINKSIIVKTMQKVTGLSVVQLQAEHSGLTQTVIDRGTSSIIQLAYTLLYNILPIIFRLVATILVICWLSIPIGSLTAVVVMSTGLGAWLINRYYWRKFKKFRDMNQGLDRQMSDILRNVVLIQSYAQEKRIIGEYAKQFDEMTDFARRLWVRYMASLHLPQNIITHLLNFVVLAIGLWEIRAGHYQIGQLVTILIWSMRLHGSLEPLTRMYRQIVQMVTAVKKYFIVMDLAPAVVVADSPFVPTSVRGGITVKDLKYVYPDQPIFPTEETEEDETETNKDKEEKKTDHGDALRGVTFTINPGERVALVGPSGAGKTTMTKLLLRFADPDKGKIEIDGRNLRDYDPLAYRAYLGAVDQEASLFDQTLRYNLTFGLNENDSPISDDELRRVLEMVRLDKLSDRLDSTIGEKGIKLSGGERQRVAIARALIKKPAILILDEPTSHLDAANEALLKEAIDEVSKGRTTIIVAHRLSTVRDADKIIVMEKGKVAAIGKHEELLETCPLYHELVRHQLMN